MKMWRKFSIIIFNVGLMMFSACSDDNPENPANEIEIGEESSSNGFIYSSSAHEMFDESSSSENVFSSSVEQSISSSSVTSSSMNESSSSVWYLKETFKTWYGDNLDSVVKTGISASKDVYVKGSDWFVFGDRDIGGFSQIEFPDPAVENAPYFYYNLLHKCIGLCASYVFNQEGLKETPFVGFGFYIADKASKDSLLAADVSDWGGLCLAYNSGTDLIVGLESLNQENSVLDNLPSVRLPASVGQVVNIPWGDFSSGAVSVDDAVKNLYAVKFKFVGENGDNGSFNIQSVGAYDGNCKLSVKALDSIPKEKNKVDALNEIFKEPGIQPIAPFETWYGADSVHRVDAGFDTEYDSKGKWTFSVASWKSGVYFLNGGDDWDIEGAIDLCGGVCTVFSPRAEDGNCERYINMHFSIAGYDMTKGINGEADASSMKGVCVVYTSDVPVTLRICQAQKVWAVRDSRLDPEIQIPAKAMAGVERIRWSEFKTPPETFPPLDGELAATRMVDFDFVVYGCGSDSYEFNIMAVGPYDGCEKYEEMK